MQSVAVLGLGYVGLPLLCAITKSPKYKALGYDPNSEKIKKISEGVCIIDDKQAQLDMERTPLLVSDQKEFIANSDIYIICVPTPIDENNYPILTPVREASSHIANYLKKGDLVILESTINPGVCEEIILPILESKSGLKGGQDFYLAHCPERINPGDGHRNVYNISRNVGALTATGCCLAADFYREILNDSVIINEMVSIKEVEATKIVENTFRDINIAFVNELAKSFDKLGINIINVIKGAANKPFAFMAHYPGCGVGGHCIAVDPYYLIEKAKSVGFDHKFLRVAREVNTSMPKYTIEKTIKALNHHGKSIKGTTIGLLGLSYKANVGDKRESPAFKIKHILEEFENTPIIFDPFFPEENTYPTLKETIDNVEAIIIATNHHEFVEYNFVENNHLHTVIDGRNCLDKNQFKNSHIYYTGIGQ